MKKSALALIFSFFLVSPILAQDRSPQKALFVSVIQDPLVLSSREEIKKLIDFSKKAGIKTLFVQIYRANKAWFPSKTADSSPYRECFKSVSEDPFNFLIKEAHASGIEVHAWLNLLSLSANEKAPILKKYGPDILTRNLEKKYTLADYKIDSQYFLEPGDPRVKKELSNIVGEIVGRYRELDGIQFDYIRYPDVHPHYGFTKTNMERFTKATGIKKFNDENPDWKDWKREQVNELLRTLVKKAREIRPDIQVSATGCMPYVRAYHEALQNWPLWIKEGIVDFVTVMTYPPDLPEFKKYLSEIKAKNESFEKINIALGAYKLVKTPEIFEQQFDFCEGSGARACVVLHYGSLLENPELQKPLAGK